MSSSSKSRSPLLRHSSRLSGTKLILISSFADTKARWLMWQDANGERADEENDDDDENPLALVAVGPFVCSLFLLVAPLLLSL